MDPNEAGHSEQGGVASARRMAIIQAANRAFALKGYSGTTIKDIATEAGIAPGTIYLYFESKRAILEGFLEHVIQLAMTRIDDLADMALEQALTALLIERFEMMRANAGMMRVLITEALFDEELAARVSKVITERVVQRVEAFLRERTSGRLSDEDLRAVVTLMPGIIVSHGVLLPALRSELAAEPATAAKAMARVIMQGINGMLEGCDGQCHGSELSGGSPSPCGSSCLFSLLVGLHI